MNKKYRIIKNINNFENPPKITYIIEKKDYVFPLFKLFPFWTSHDSYGASSWSLMTSDLEAAKYKLDVLNSGKEEYSREEVC